MLRQERIAVSEVIEGKGQSNVRQRIATSNEPQRSDKDCKTAGQAPLSVADNNGAPLQREIDSPHNDLLDSFANPRLLSTIGSVAETELHHLRRGESLWQDLASGLGHIRGKQYRLHLQENRAASLQRKRQLVQPMCRNGAGVGGLARSNYPHRTIQQQYRSGPSSTFGSCMAGPVENIIAESSGEAASKSSQSFSGSAESRYKHKRESPHHLEPTSPTALPKQAGGQKIDYEVSTKLVARPHQVVRSTGVSSIQNQQNEQTGRPSEAPILRLPDPVPSDGPKSPSLEAPTLVAATLSSSVSKESPQLLLQQQHDAASTAMGIVDSFFPLRHPVQMSPGPRRQLQRHPPELHGDIGADTCSTGKHFAEEGSPIAEATTMLQKQASMTATPVVVGSHPESLQASQSRSTSLFPMKHHKEDSNNPTPATKIAASASGAAPRATRHKPLLVGEMWNYECGRYPRAQWQYAVSPGERRSQIVPAPSPSDCGSTSRNASSPDGTLSPPMAIQGATMRSSSCKSSKLRRSPMNLNAQWVPCRPSSQAQSPRIAIKHHHSAEKPEAAAAEGLRREDTGVTPLPGMQQFEHQSMGHESVAWTRSEVAIASAASRGQPPGSPTKAASHYRVGRLCCPGGESHRSGCSGREKSDREKSDREKSDRESANRWPDSTTEERRPSVKMLERVMCRSVGLKEILECRIGLPGEEDSSTGHSGKSTVSDCRKAGYNEAFSFGAVPHAMMLRRTRDVTRDSGDFDGDFYSRPDSDRSISTKYADDRSNYDDGTSNCSSCSSSNSRRRNQDNRTISAWRQGDTTATWGAGSSRSKDCDGWSSEDSECSLRIVDRSETSLSPSTPAHC